MAAEMTSRIVPAFPAAPALPLRRLELLRTIIRNPVEAWPQPLFQDLSSEFRIFGRPTVAVMDPDLIRSVLVDEADAFAKGDVLVRSLQPALGQGILTSDGSPWRWQRRAAAPIFRHERLLQFVPSIFKAAEITAEQWLAREPGTVVDVAHEMMRTTFAIILDTMLSDPEGLDALGFERSITEYLEPVGWQAALSLLGAPHWAPFPGRGRALRARDYFRRELARIITSRRHASERPRDLLSLLMEARDAETGREMTDSEIADNLLTFVTAGHETTALALTWTFYLLSIAPAVEKRVLAEIAAATRERPIEESDLAADFPYTRQVIQESMRLYPPAPMIVRRAIRDLTIGGIPIRANTNVQVPVYVVHRHRRIWKDPDVFDPERFAAEQVKTRHRYAYLPFGAGPRICIGMGFALMEATAILTKLLSVARLEMVPGHVPHPVLRITLRPRGGMPMRIYARK